MAFIALGVTGGIGAYKAVEIARGLQKNGHDVVAIMTRSARAVRRPADLRGDYAPRGDHRPVEAGRQRRHRAHRHRLEHRSAAGRAGHRQHASASSRNGLADDFLSSLYLATTRAGDDRAGDEHATCSMHPAVAKNLRDASRRAACTSSSPAPATWRAAGSARGGSPSRRTWSPTAEQVLQPKTATTLAGRGVLVTAGPTFEDIDPVRFVGNRSSGRMGYALAVEALRRGAAVTLVSGPTHLDAPPRRRASCRCAAPPRCIAAVMDARGRAGRRDHGRRGRRLHAGGAGAAEDAEVRRAADDCACRAPGHPRRCSASCRRGSRDGRCWSASPRRPTTSSPTREASCRGRSADLIVANDVSRTDAGFDVDTNAVTLVSADQAPRTCRCSRRRPWPRILDRVEQLLAGSARRTPQSDSVHVARSSRST